MHFGRSDEAINAALLDQCQRIQGHVYILSGDFTQRALISEYESAQLFVQSLGVPKKRIVAIPGNHDIEPFYKPLARMRIPYDRYMEYIAPHTSPSYADRHVAIGSINTVRAARLKGGHVSKQSLTAAEEWFAQQPQSAARLLVTHHPLDLPPTSPKRKLARKSKRGIYHLSKSRIDCYISGHYHRSSAVVTRIRYPKDHYAAIALQAGTVSLRSRGQSQSFNVLHIDHGRITVTVFMWNLSLKRFLPTDTFEFQQDERGWLESNAV